MVSQVESGVDESAFTAIERETVNVDVFGAPWVGEIKVNTRCHARICDLLPALFGDFVVNGQHTAIGGGVEGFELHVHESGCVLCARL